MFLAEVCGIQYSTFSFLFTVPLSMGFISCHMAVPCLEIPVVYSYESTNGRKTYPRWHRTSFGIELIMAIMTSHLLPGLVPIELTALPSVLKGKDISRGSRLLAGVAAFREVTNSSGRALRDAGRSREMFGE